MCGGDRLLPGDGSYGVVFVRCIASLCNHQRVTAGLRGACLPLASVANPSTVAQWCGAEFGRIALPIVRAPVCYCSPFSLLCTSRTTLSGRERERGGLRSARPEGGWVCVCGGAVTAYESARLGRALAGEGGDTCSWRSLLLLGMGE